MDRNIDSDDYEKTLLLYKPYIQQANEAGKHHTDVIKKLDSLDGIGQLKTNKYFNDLEDSLCETEQLMKSSHHLLDLNEFVKIQQENCTPFVATERTITYQLGNKDNSNINQKIYNNEDTYVISFEEIEETKEIRINFTWQDHLKLWTYDLMVEVSYNYKYKININFDNGFRKKN